MVEEDTNDTGAESGAAEESDSIVWGCPGTCATDDCSSICARGIGHLGEHACMGHR